MKTLTLNVWSGDELLYSTEKSYADWISDNCETDDPDYLSSLAVDKIEILNGNVKDINYYDAYGELIRTESYTDGVLTSSEIIEDEL